MFTGFFLEVSIRGHEDSLRLFGKQWLDLWDFWWGLVIVRPTSLLVRSSLSWGTCYGYSNVSIGRCGLDLLSRADGPLRSR